MVCGQHPFIDTVTQLGHLIHCDLSDVQDIIDKLLAVVTFLSCLLSQ